MAGISDPDWELLDQYDPEPVNLLNAEGRSPFLLLGDHAGNAIPRALGTLGISEADRSRHIALDIGVGQVGERLAERLDAAFVHQSYSRLVIDCNRDPSHPDAIAEVSDGSAIPANCGIGAGEREERVQAIHAPYHARIAQLLGQRAAQGRDTILISLHSFTPVMGGEARPWEIGVLHSEGDTSFAQPLLTALRGAGSLTVGDNAPYQMDMTDYTVPLHCFAAGLRYAEIEMRQDLIADAPGQDRWSRILAEALETALGR